MRPLTMSTLLAALQALVVLSAGGCQTSESAMLELRSAAEVGPQATAAKGPRGEPAIEVAGGAAESTSTLYVDDKPTFPQPARVFRGRIKYDGVAGGYLEVLCDVPDREPYRTHLELDGTSDWGSFEIGPVQQSGSRFRRISLNVVLPGAGKVTVGQPLVYGPRRTNDWWTEQQAGMIGGGLGALFGILGGLIGLSASWGKSRSLTVSLLCIGLAVGGISMVAGLVALFVGQPWHVCYPLLLIGTVSLCALGGNLPQILRRFQNDERRRMTGLDAV